MSQPVADLIDEGPEVLKVAGEKGYRYFTRIEDFKKYIKNDILGDHYYGLPGWAADVDEKLLPLVRHLVAHKLPQPECGYELQNSGGEVVAEFELAWTQRKIGIWTNRGNETQIDPRPLGWRTYDIQDVVENPNLLSF